VPAWPAATSREGRRFEREREGGEGERRREERLRVMGVARG
jgi:hypothetical protein